MTIKGFLKLCYGFQIYYYIYIYYVLQYKSLNQSFFLFIISMLEQCVMYVWIIRLIETKYYTGVMYVMK